MMSKCCGKDSEQLILYVRVNGPVLKLAQTNEGLFKGLFCCRSTQTHLIQSGKYILTSKSVNTLLFFHVNTLKWKHTGMLCGWSSWLRWCWKLLASARHSLATLKMSPTQTYAAWLNRHPMEIWFWSNKVWSVSPLWILACMHYLTTRLEVFSQRPLPQTALSATAIECVWYASRELNKCLGCVVKPQHMRHGLTGLEGAPVPLPSLHVFQWSPEEVWKGNVRPTKTNRI